MRSMLLSLAAAAACLPCSIGCQSAPVARGQQPEYCPPGYGAGMAYGECPADCDECRHDASCCCCKCRPYCIPNDLVYPPPGDMPAIVQYPYYTNKGPDCFFHPPLR